MKIYWFPQKERFERLGLFCLVKTESGHHRILAEISSEHTENVKEKDL